jgi:hypothetical protein
MDLPHLVDAVDEFIKEKYNNNLHRAEYCWARALPLPISRQIVKIRSNNSMDRTL